MRTRVHGVCRIQQRLLYRSCHRYHHDRDASQNLILSAQPSITGPILVLRLPVEIVMEWCAANGLGEGDERWGTHAKCWLAVGRGRSSLLPTVMARCFLRWRDGRKAKGKGGLASRARWPAICTCLSPHFHQLLTAEASECCCE